MTTQPTHHGYAVNVKDHSYYQDNRGPLTDDDAQVIYDRRAEDFWHFDVQEIARAHGFAEAFSAGRSAGYVVPSPQPRDMWNDEFDAWEAEVFRPFERDILAAAEQAREDFREALAEAVERAIAEPSERAEWEARGTMTIGRNA